MKEKKQYSFSELAQELNMAPEELAAAIKDGDLPKPARINRISGECFFKDENDYNKTREGLESSPLSPEEFFALFEKRRGRPKKSTPTKKTTKKKSSKKSASTENTGGKRRGRPPKAK